MSIDSMEGLKAFAKDLVSQYFLGTDAARFAVVSFQSFATTRVGWSTDEDQINAAIDQMSPDGNTSNISAAFESVGALLAHNTSRPTAAKIVVFVSDGEQSDEFAAPGKDASQAAIDAAALVKGDGATVFAAGFGGDVNLTTLTEIASDQTKALVVAEVGQLSNFLKNLEDAVCNESPPPSPTLPPLSPPPPTPPPPSPSPPRKRRLNVGGRQHGRVAKAPAS